MHGDGEEKENLLIQEARQTFFAASSLGAGARPSTAASDNCPPPLATALGEK